MDRRVVVISALALAAAAGGLAYTYVGAPGRARGAASASAPFVATDADASRILEPGVQVERLASGFQFTEGPAVDAQGDLFFTDIRASRIHRRSAAEGRVSTFLEGSGGANGLAFDRDGHLIACEGDRGRVTAIDRDGRATVLADAHGGKRFNKPNDLWIDPRGGIYFTDPAYGVPVVQGGEHVYYLPPDGGPVARVIDDLVRPNGIVGTPDGKRLYVTDHAGGRTFAYAIGAGGALSGKRLAAPCGGDGMKLDAEGSLYIAAHDGVRVYDPDGGRPLAMIRVPESPTNLCFTGDDLRTLVITARTSVYSVRVKVPGRPR